MAEIFLQSDKLQILMAKLSDFAYFNNSEFVNGDRIFAIKEIEKWRYFQLDDIDDSLKSVVFCAKNDEEKKLAIVFKGSEPSIFNLEGFISDWCISDFYMVVGKLPLRFFDCLEYIRKIRMKFPDYQFYMTGHSLGGSMAQLLATIEENSQIDTYTYNAYGVKHLLKCLEEAGLSPCEMINNIYNFCMDSDLVSNKDVHLGVVYIIHYNKKFPQTILSLIKELPKIFVGLPLKLWRSIKYYFHCLKLFYIKLDSHLMNNFTSGFEYKSKEDK